MHNSLDGPPFSLIRCVMIFFGALSGIGYTDNTEKALSADEMLVHAMKTDQQFSADLEAKLGEMKRLENEWAAKRRTAKDVSSRSVGAHHGE